MRWYFHGCRVFPVYDETRKIGVKLTDCLSALLPDRSDEDWTDKMLDKWSAGEARTSANADRRAIYEGVLRYGIPTQCLDAIVRAKTERQRCGLAPPVSRVIKNKIRKAQRMARRRAERQRRKDERAWIQYWQQQWKATAEEFDQACQLIDQGT